MKRGHIDRKRACRQKDGHRDSMKESAKGRFFEEEKMHTEDHSWHVRTVALKPQKNTQKNKVAFF